MSPPEPEQLHVTPAVQGAVYKPLHVERKVKIYPIQEYELKSIAMLNTTATICCSVASGAFVYMLSVIWDMAATSDEKTDKTGWAFILVCVIVMLTSLGFATYCWWCQKSQLKDILSQTNAATLK